MNRFEPSFNIGHEAKLKYLDADFQIITPGEFVRCAVSGKVIRLDELKYWSVERQEAYASAEVATKRFLELQGR